MRFGCKLNGVGPRASGLGLRAQGWFRGLGVLGFGALGF